jgi:outer membrane receptor protein involved in Fe transport
VNAKITSGDYDGNRMCAVPRQQASLNTKLYLFEGFSIRGGCRYTDDQYTISDLKNEFRKLKAYTLFSIGFQYECPNPLDGLVVSFDIDNLFDRDYCDYATYGAYFYPAAGRSYTAKIGYTF